MKNNPTISVIMGIYNCESTLTEAIDCIVAQTCTDWELILCDDGSSDGTYAIAAGYADQYPDRIKLIRNDRNRGLNYTLNHCLKYASGQYIARMDGDDLCRSDRLEIELDYLKQHPDIAIVSSDMEVFDESGVWGMVRHVKNPKGRDFMKSSPFSHAPCMVKKEAYDRVEGYGEGPFLNRVEDYHLWIKMYEKGYRGYNIYKPLYQMRDDRNAYNRRKFRYRINEAYVKCLAVRKLKLPFWYYVYALRPIIVGILPEKLYDKVHKLKLNRH